MKFPDTKYMGSKQELLPFIIHNVRSLKFETVLDAFSGSGCVGYTFKAMGKQVITNDFLKFAYHTARASIENNTTILSDRDITHLLHKNRQTSDFIQKTFKDLYFNQTDCEFLDNLWQNGIEFNGTLKHSLILAAAARACMKKRPRGIFTFVGKKGWDGRRDLQLSMKEQFLNATRLFNEAVFSNNRRNKSFCQDVFNLEPKGIDLVYIDTPYISPYSDCDYTRRYHFVEGYVTYWHGVEIMWNTKTKKISSYETLFSSKQKATDAFRKLFHHFRRSILVVSYSSNGIPDKQGMINLLKEFKNKVSVSETQHMYSHGNHNHKVGNNRNAVKEYLFIAQ